MTTDVRFCLSHV